MVAPISRMAPRSTYGQKCVLLAAIEAMNFIDEQNRAHAGGSGLIGLRHDLFDFFNPADDGGKFDERGFGGVGDDLGQRGFSHAGRSPQNHRRGVVGFQLQTQCFAGSKQMFLADEFIQCARTHAFGQRPLAQIGRGFVCICGIAREVRRTGSWLAFEGCEAALPRCLVEHNGGGDGGVQRFNVAWAGNVKTAVAEG